MLGNIDGATLNYRSEGEMAEAEEVQLPGY
jgi:hypothetical protein